jgi:hypothetical protein
MIDDEDFEVDDEDLNQESEEGDDESEVSEEVGDEEADEEGQDEGSEDEDEKGSRVLTRGEKRFQSLSKRAREAESERLRLQTEKSDLQRRLEQIQNQANGSKQADYQAYLATLAPEERAIEEARNATRMNQYQIQQLEFRLQDNGDRSAYQAKALANDIYSRFESQVEDKLATLQRQQGIWAPREEILKNIIGEMVLKNKLKPANKVKAKQNVKKNTVKSGSSRSDMSSNRGQKNGSTDRNRRLGEATF